MKILVTGAQGQLGSDLAYLAQHTDWQWIYTDKDDLDITDQQAVMDFFAQGQFTHCINCAAYTAVDRAEEDQAFATLLNVQAVQHIASACKQFGVQLIHISTDFVFDGQSFMPLKEEQVVSPVNHYGLTKWQGEQEALSILPEALVIRTSWLYSSYGKNFVKTMQRLGRERDELGVIVDQIGTPTHAADLAQTIITLLPQLKKHHDFGGVYHYSNEGVASWYDFAHEIFEQSQIDVNLKPLATHEYPTPARRPHYSVMDKTKIKKTFGITIAHWKESLANCIDKLD